MNSSSDVLIVGNRLIGWRNGVNGTARCRDNLRGWVGRGAGEQALDGPLLPEADRAFVNLAGRWYHRSLQGMRAARGPAC